MPTACTWNKEEQSRRLVTIGAKYYDEGKYRPSVIACLKAIQLAPRNGEAYYQLGLSYAKLQNHARAFGAFVRAFELQGTTGYDAYPYVADMLLLSAADSQDTAERRIFLADLEQITDVEEIRNPGSRNAIRIRGAILVLRDQHEAAVEVFEKVLAQDPSDRKAIVALSNALLKTGQQRAFEQLARKVLGEQGDFRELYQLLYRYLMEQRRNDDAVALLGQQVAGLPGRVEPRLELAAHHARLGRPAEARRVIDEMLKEDIPGSFLGAGEFYARTGDAAQALEFYRRGMEREPKRAETYQGKMVEALLFQQRTEEARKLADELASSYPDSARVKALRGSMRLAREPAGALADLREAVKLDPENGAYCYALGLAERANGDTREAERQLRKAVNLLPSFVPPKLALADLYMSLYSFSQADTVISEALQTEPRNLLARYLRVRVGIQMRLFQRTREELAALAADPAAGQREVGLLLAMLARAEGRLGEARQIYEALGKQHRSDPDVLNGLLETLLAMNRFEELRRILLDQQKQNPQDVEIRIALASWHLKTGDIPGARQAFARLAEELPRNATVLTGLGRADHLSGNPRKAEPVLLEALALDASSKYAPLYLGIICAEEGRQPEARRYFEQALKLDPNEVVALNNLAFLLAEAGEDLERSLVLAQRAVANAPNDASVQDTLGLVYLKKGIHDSAIEVFRRNVARQPDNPTWRYHLGMALAAKGEFSRARIELEAGLRNNPSPTEKKKIEDLLKTAVSASGKA